jgi:hypothetical protein
VLLRKAAVDRGFRAKLLKAPAAAADAIGLPLEAAEAALLRAVAPDQLDGMVAHTEVDAASRPLFLGADGRAMLRALESKPLAHTVKAAVVGSTVGPLDAVSGWMKIAAVVGVILVPLILLVRWLHRRSRRGTP